MKTDKIYIKRTDAEHIVKYLTEYSEHICGMLHECLEHNHADEICFSDCLGSDDIENLIEIADYILVKTNMNVFPIGCSRIKVENTIT